MKYKLTNNTKIVDGVKLYQIQSLSDGELGGFIQSKSNLSQQGNCWVYEDGIVKDKAKVKDNSFVTGLMDGHSKALGNSFIFGEMHDYSIAHDSVVEGKMFDDSKALDFAQINGTLKEYSMISRACIRKSATLINCDVREEITISNCVLYNEDLPYIHINDNMINASGRHNFININGEIHHYNTWKKLVDKRFKESFLIKEALYLIYVWYKKRKSKE